MYDIYFDLSDMHQTVDSADDDEGEEFWLDGDAVHYDLVQNDDYIVVKKNKNGCICKECMELFPYAEPNQSDGTLICYSCRRFMKK